MELTEAIKKRKSIRVYKNESVPEAVLQRVLEAARLAPSASNQQRWKFIVVRDPEKRKLLSIAANGQPHVAGAPVVIAGIATDINRIMMCGLPTYQIDLAIAIDHITLAAVNEGLGTCWIGAFSQEQARKVLGVPDSYTIVGLLPLGFPAEEGRPKNRKSLDEIVCYETFSE